MAKAKSKPSKAGTKKTTAARKAAPAKKAARPAAKAAKAPRAATRAAAVATATFHEFMTHGASATRTIEIKGAPRFFGAAEATTLSELTLLVQTRMNEGWVPAGGINVDAQGSFVQALVRY